MKEHIADVIKGLLTLGLKETGIKRIIYFTSAIALTGLSIYLSV